MSAVGDGGWKVLGRDWFGERVEPPLEFRIVFEGGALVFSVRREGAADLGERDAGAFREGLWKNDVGELFLGGEGKGNYLEFHIAPDGCWWVGEFAGENRGVVSRWEDGNGPEGFSAGAEAWGERGWLATLRIPVDFLKAKLGGDVRAWRGNVAAMVREGERRRFLSANAPGEAVARPDFHRADLRGELDW